MQHPRKDGIMADAAPPEGPPLMRFEVKVLCHCGHFYTVEVMLRDKGIAPLACPGCGLHLALAHVEQPKLRIIADPRKPPEEMIQVERVKDPKDKKLIH